MFRQIHLKTFLAIKNFVYCMLVIKFLFLDSSGIEPKTKVRQHRQKQRNAGKPYTTASKKFVKGRECKPLPLF